MSLEDCQTREILNRGFKIALMDVTSTTNARTVIATVLNERPCGHKVPTLTPSSYSIQSVLTLVATINSYTFDLIIRSLINCDKIFYDFLVLAVDRTQWKDKNLFMAAVIHKKRALPIYWQFLPKKGASNFQEQKAILKAVLKLLKSYQLIVLGDREFDSIELANWLHSRKVSFVLRQKKDRKIKEKGGDYQFLSTFEFYPGQSHFFSTLKGQSLLRKGQKEYVSRLRKVHQVMTKNSKFLLGLYGQVWIITQSFVQDWVKQLMRLNRNKLPFYQRGLRAMELIQQGL